MWAGDSLDGVLYTFLHVVMGLKTANRLVYVFFTLPLAISQNGLRFKIRVLYLSHSFFLSLPPLLLPIYTYVCVLLLLRSSVWYDAKIICKKEKSKEKFLGFRWRSDLYYWLPFQFHAMTTTLFPVLSLFFFLCISSVFSLASCTTTTEKCSMM